MMVPMMMVVMAMDYHHNLRLRRVGCRETENESECEQNPFHTSVWRTEDLNTELL